MFRGKFHPNGKEKQTRERIFEVKYSNTEILLYITKRKKPICFDVDSGEIIHLLLTTKNLKYNIT